MSKFIGKNGIVLAVFALVSTLLIGLTYEGTKGQIAIQQNRQLNQMLNSVLPNDLYTNDLANSCVLLHPTAPLSSPQWLKVFVATKDNQTTGVAIESNAPKGYSGNIKFLVGISGASTVTGVRVLAHKETPGLGDKIDLRVSDWITSFDAQQVSPQTLSRWAVKKDGGQFDQFTGATITPRALVSAVRDTVLFYQQNQSLLASAPECTTNNIEQ